MLHSVTCTELSSPKRQGRGTHSVSELEAGRALGLRQVGGWRGRE
jgi:hypothetical protein